MAVKVCYYSDRDPKTMFDSKKEADEYDRKLEAIEQLSELLGEAASAVKLKLDEDQVYELADRLLSEHRDTLTAIVTGKKIKVAG